MEGLILLATLFLTCVMLTLGVVFVVLALRLLEATKPQVFAPEETQDTITLPKNVPIDQFMPAVDKPLTVKYSDKDQITKI